MTRITYYDEAQVNFLRENVKKLKLGNLTNAFNKRFSLNKSKSSIESLIFRLKLRKENPVKYEVRKPLYTPEIINFILKTYKNHTAQKTTDLTNEKFGTSYELIQIRNMLKRKNFTCDRKFENPFKGTIGLVKAKRTSFKKGNIPHNALQVGSETLDANGYIKVKVSSNPSVFRLKHHLVYEQHHNVKITSKMNIMFKDRNRLNVNIENLFLVTKKEKVILQRMKYDEYPIEMFDTLVLMAKLKAKLTERQS